MISHCKCLNMTLWVFKHCIGQKRMGLPFRRKRLVLLKVLYLFHIKEFFLYTKKTELNCWNELNCWTELYNFCSLLRVSQDLLFVTSSVHWVFASWYVVCEMGSRNSWWRPNIHIGIWYKIQEYYLLLYHRAAECWIGQEALVNFL